MVGFCLQCQQLQPIVVGGFVGWWGFVAGAGSASDPRVKGWGGRDRNGIRARLQLPQAHLQWPISASQGSPPNGWIVLKAVAHIGDVEIKTWACGSSFQTQTMEASLEVTGFLSLVLGNCVGFQLGTISLESFFIKYQLYWCKWEMLMVLKIFLIWLYLFYH